MATHYIPRNVKGEGRILFIFSGKSFLYSMIGGGVGLLFYLIFSALNLYMVGIGFVIVFAIIGFIIGTFKMPEITKFEFTRKTGGENIDDVIKRAIKFKMQKNRVYVYKTSTKEKEPEKLGGEK